MVSTTISLDLESMQWVQEYAEENGLKFSQACSQLIKKGRNHELFLRLQAREAGGK